MILADAPFFVSVSGTITFAVTVVGVPSLGWLLRRMITRMDERTEQLDKLTERVSTLAGKVDAINTTQSQDHTLLQRVSESTVSLNTVMTMHLEQAGQDKDYLLRRIDEDRNRSGSN